MNHLAPRFALLVVSFATLVSGCSKKDAPAAPAPSASAPVVVAVAAPEPTASAAASAARPLAPTPRPVSSQATADAASIRACCAALHAEAAKATPAEKSITTTAAATCDVIAQQVQASTTSRSSALTSLQAALRAKSLPAACH